MPTGRVAIDTDVASHIWRGDLSPILAERLIGRTPVLTFVTVAEMLQGAHHADWGSRKMQALAEFHSRFAKLHCDGEVVREWGRLAGQAMRRGHKLSHNDCWIAACCVVGGVPLLTGNERDFLPLVHLNLGLQLA